MRRFKRNRKLFALLFSFLLIFSMFAPQSTYAETASDNSATVDHDLLEKEREAEYQEKSEDTSNEEKSSDQGKEGEVELASLMEGLGWEPPSLSGQSPQAETKPDKVEADILNQLEKKEKVDVIIRMKERPDIEAIFPQVKAKKSKAEKVKLLKTHLEEKAKASQKALDKAMNSLEQKGKAKKNKSFWIINAMSATVSKDALKELQKRDDIEQITLDRVLKVPEIQQDENPPKLPQWGLEKIKATKVWGDYGLKGEGVVVGIMDTGVDGTHEALKHNYRGRDGDHSDSWIDLSGEGYSTPSDGHGHGTHVAGSAVGGGAGEAIGVAPEAEWIAAKIFSDGGSTTTSAIHEAFQWFMAPGGDTSKAPDVVNNSWGNANTYNMEFYEDVQAWVSAGIFPMFAAGNDGPGSQTIGAPGSFPQSFAIGATDVNDQIAYFSSRGPVYWEDENGNQVRLLKPDVAAPGHHIYSAWPTAKGEGKYNTISGTSMATPHVTGAVALLLQSNPDLTVDEIKELLRDTARVEPFMGALPNDVYGHGIVDIYQAVTETAFAGELKGTLKNADGEPISGTIQFNNGVFYDIADDGVIDLKIREGSHEVVIKSFGYEDQTLTIDIQKDEVTDVEWVLERATSYALEGKVVEADSGDTVPFAYIRVMDTPLEPARTDEQGNFTLGQIPVGTYELQVSGEGIAGTSLEVTMDADQNIQIEVGASESSSKPGWNTANNNNGRNAVSPSSIDINKLDLGWEYELGSKGEILFSTPAVADQSVVLTTDRGWVVNLDTETGEENWSIRLGATNRSTPTIEDGVVYLSGGQDGRIYALNLSNGNILWNYQTDSITVYESPIYHDGKLFVGSGLDENAHVTALNAETGEKIWSTPLGAPTFFGGSLGDGKLYVGSYDNMTIRAIDIADGSEVWSKTLTNEGVAARTVYVDGELYVVGTNFNAETGTLYKLDPNSGEEIWKVEGIGDTQAGSPVVYEDLVVMTSAAHPLLRAFDRETGEIVWTNRAVGSALHNGSVTSNGILFVAGTSGTFYALDVYTGKRLKEFPLPDYSTSGLPVLPGKVLVPYTKGIQSYQSPGVLIGTMKDGDGQPVKGKVSVLETGVEVEADENGNFTLEHRPGEYTVKVAQYGKQQVEETIRFVSGYERTKDYVLEAADTGSLQIQVKDQRSQDGLSDVEILLKDTSVEGTTNENGLYTDEAVFEGKYELVLSLNGYVEQKQMITVTSGEETIIDVEMQPIDIAVLNDWNSEVTKLLNVNGYTAEERDWDIVEDIERYQVVYLNGAYGSGGEQPDAATFDSLVQAAEEHDVNLIFADQWGSSYGSIEHLNEYYGDPKEFDHQYDGGAVRLEVDVAHPIFEGYEVGDRMTLFERTGDLTWFNQYSGRHLGSIGNTSLGFVGSGVAYKAVSEDSAHLLLSSHGAAPWISPLQGWLGAQQQILFNGIDFLNEAEYGHVSGTVVDVDGEPVEAQIEIVETGVKTQAVLGEGSGANADYELFHDPGTYTMEIRALGYETQTQEVTFTHGEPAEVFITLGASNGGTITGLVTDSNTQQVVKEAQVTVTNEAGDVVAETTTGTNGRYEVSDLEDIVYTITIEKEGYINKSEQIDMARFEGELNVELSPVPQLAVIGDYWSAERNFASVFNDIGVEVTEIPEGDAAEQIGNYDVVFFNDGDFNKSEFDAMMKAADEHETSVIFGEHYWSGSGIEQLVDLRGDPETRETFSGSTLAAGYQVTQEHPIFNGAKVGDFIELLIPAASDIGAFDGYSGYPLAQIKHEGDSEPYGTGLAYKPRTSGSMEVLMAGHGFYFSHDADDYTPEAKELLVNTVLWAAEAQYSTISGTITDEAGNPLDAEVKVNGMDFSDKTNPEDGTFSIAILDGEYEVEIQSFGYQSETMTVNVSENSTPLTIDMDVKDNVGSITGVIESEKDGNAVEGATIDVLDVPRATTTNTQGQYSIERLEPGTYTLRVEKDGYVRQDIEVEITDSEEVTLPIDLKPSPTVGVIVDITASGYTTLKEYLEERGYLVEYIGYEDTDRLAEMDLVFANSDYTGSQVPSESEFKAFLKALDETKTSVIWTGQDGGRGSIRFLQDYLNDPTTVFGGSEEGSQGTVVEEHPLTEGLDLNETFDIPARFDYYYGFDGYSGHTAVEFKNDNTGDQGSMVAYKGRTNDSVEILLANMTYSHVWNTNQSFDPVREKILNNALLWALDNEEALVGELHGQVVNDQGMAVKATVEIAENGKTIETDSEGSFYAGLEEGSYELTINAFGHEEKTFTVNISNGDTLEETFELTAENAGVVNGIVKDGETGDPIADASVSFLGTPIEASTDENGEFSVSAPEGEYDIKVLASGYGANTQSNVQVVAGEEVDLTFSMQTSQKLAVIGYSPNEARLVPFLESNGYDVDFYQRDDYESLQQALADYQLVIFNDKDYSMTNDQFRAFVEEANELEVSMIFVSQYGGGTIKSLADAYGDPESVRSSFESQSINVKVDQLHPIFSGFEVGDEIEILNNGNSNQQYSVYENFSGTTIGSLTHDEEGVLGEGIGIKYPTANNVHVLLSGLQAGGYGSPESRWTDEAKQIYLNAIDFATTASLGEIKGTVTDADGNPISNAKVTIPSEGIEVTTTDDGSYRLGVGVGHYEVKVQARGFVEQVKEADVAELGDSVTLNFTMEAIEGVSLSGQIINAETEDGIEGVQLTLTPEDPAGFVEETTTDVSGGYAFENLLPGNYELKMEVDGYLPSTETITVGEEDVEANLSMNAYQVAVLGDVNDALVNFLNDQEVYAESRDWNLLGQVEDYSLILVNTKEGTTEQVEQLIEESDEKQVSVVFVGTWGVGEGSIQLLETAEGYPQKDQHGYDEGAVYIQPLKDHPLFEGLVEEGNEDTPIKVHAAKSPYSTFKDYPGMTLAELLVDETEKGSSIAYEFRSESHMHLLLSSFAVTNIIGPEYGWTEEGKQLFTNSLKWAMDAEQQAPNAPEWDDEELKFKHEPVIVTGKADPGTTVHVYAERGNARNELGSVQTKPDGTFEIELEIGNGSYFLRAEAENFAGTAESENRLHVIVAGKPDTQPEAEATVKDGNVQLTWKAQDAERYVIERNGEQISEVKEVSFTDETVEPGQEYTYQITAIMGDGDKISYDPLTITIKELQLAN
ncbi:carboxypeptidase regulatory-like domain-containing protein [Pseudalkalibacillus sp. R45]|uniref:carboxypeptidase regulatory-like domain-containing protein n=1 Tax=Pseudalkalibacillus sp. R45 TaxID=3457433 RepID=UPI003FCD91D2